jgi:hypothetical protein
MSHSGGTFWLSLARAFVKEGDDVGGEALSNKKA